MGGGGGGGGGQRKQGTINASEIIEIAKRLDIELLYCSNNN